MELLKHAPRLDRHAAIALGEHLYGIRAGASELPSERDQNFLLTTDRGEKFILKIANALELRPFLEAQNRLLTHLSVRLSFCPHVLSRVSGQTIETASADTGEVYLVRLLSYLPGVPLGNVKNPTSQLYRDLGSKLGQLSAALRDFDDSALHRDFHWDLAKGLNVLSEYAPLISDAGLRRFIDECTRKLASEKAHLWPKLRRSIIHGDANDYNILVSEVGEPNKQTITGLIDFGDLLHSFTVSELAVATAYAMLGKPDPLETAVVIAAGYLQHYSLTEDELKALWGLVLLRLCVSACMAARQQRQAPDNAYLAISQKAIVDSLPQLAAIEWEQAADCFLSALRDESELTKGTLAIRRRLLGRNLSVAYQHPLKIVRGSMQYLYGDDGREYLDAYNNVAHVGHCHPRVVRAAQQQIAQLNTNTRYLHDLINRYAGRLTATLPPELSVCFFVNSGSEANELALRLARAHTNAHDLIVLDHAYHGNTTTLIDISPYKHDGPGGCGAPAWVHKAPLPDLYRGTYRSDDPLAAGRYAEAVSSVIADLQHRGIHLSAFIAESWPSVAGQIVLPSGYLGRVYAAVRSAGGLCIADEVQTGYGRVGTHFWGFESQQVVPDIVVLGKPIGNGHPIGAVITTPSIAASFDNGMEFFSTFGGNTVSCAIGLEVLNVVQDEDLQAHAFQVGEQMLARLRSLMNRHEVIGDVRGSGFFIGVELVRNRDTLEPAGGEANGIVNRLRDRGILIGTDGPFHNVLKIRPPMPFSAANAERLIEALEEAIGRVVL